MVTANQHIVARQFQLKKGMDLRLDGAPPATVSASPPVRSVALLGSDLPGIKPTLLVAVGDHVLLGQPLMHARHDPELRITAPGTGTITAINFGEQRRLASLVITLDEPGTAQAVVEPAGPSLSSALVRQRLLQTGLWTAFRTRPFGAVPGSGDTPDAIFVTAIDSAPLAGDPRVMISRDADAFRHGVAALTHLTGGLVYVCRAPGVPLPLPDTARIVDAVFSGPHPAGLPGTHMHFLHPVGAARTAWHLGCQDVIAIGQLLATGVLEQRRVVAVGGTIAEPRLLDTRLGACISDLVGTPDVALRVLSGDALSGRAVTDADGWLGRYDQQVTVLRDDLRVRPRRWLATALKSLLPETSVRGRRTGMLPLDIFEQVLPLDLLPSPLLRALLLRDTETAVRLGCLELGEDDLALCSYVCPARQDYAAALRATLDDYRRNG